MMTVDQLLEQLEILNKTYLWTIKESEKILQEIDIAWKEEDMVKVEQLRDRFMEIENRHNLDRAQYNKVIKQSRQYFLRKYNIDLLRIFELEDI